MALAFAMLTAAALVRSVGVVLWPAQMMLMIDISGLLWVLAFTLYVIKFGPMLLKARVDGHPG